MLGGRWKPLHYVLKRDLYGSIGAACGISKNLTNASDFVSLCYLRNDDGYRGLRGARLEVSKLMLDGSSST